MRLEGDVVRVFLERHPIAGWPSTVLLRVAKTSIMLDLVERLRGTAHPEEVQLFLGSDNISRRRYSTLEELGVIKLREGFLANLDLKRIASKASSSPFQVVTFRYAAMSPEFQEYLEKLHVFIFNAEGEDISSSARSAFRWCQWQSSRRWSGRG